MWSLFKKKESDSGIGEGLFDYSAVELQDGQVHHADGEEMKPLKFSNGKTQEDVVKEVLDAIDVGNKIIFIRGICGTGKSAIALNLARHFNKTSIVVPIKSLQEQYEQDYTKKSFILKKDGKKMKIAAIKGRNNFICPFTGERCDDKDLPCTIELREKNIDKIKEFIDMNPAVEKFDFAGISDVRRMSIAPACPYWSPLLPAEINSKSLEGAKKKRYNAICGKEYALFHRKKGCGYYDQYEDYVDADVLIFNSRKYLLESAIGRKPKTDLDIIDECDEFLDNFADEEKINVNRLISALSNLFPETSDEKNAIKELIFLANEVLLEDVDDIEKVENTKVVDLIRKVLDNPYIAEDEDTNYYNNVFEMCKSFENLLKETYVSYDRVKKDGEQEGLFGSYRGEESVYVNLVSINLAQKFKDLAEQNSVLVLMSGTLHSEQVLKDIFGLENFKVVEAETEMPGTITKYRTGMEKNCKYANFSSGLVSREDYLKALECCLKNADAPVLVHVSSFGDLPSEMEKGQFGIENVVSREKLLEMQFRDKDNRLVDDFKSGGVDVLFTTKCSRGVDFPGEKCKSIVLTKYPYPNIQGLFWKILKKEKPDKFMEFYMDKARRELVQKIMRGVRFKGDHVLLLSPDSRVLDGRVS